MQTTSALGATLLVLYLHLDSSFASEHIRGISSQTTQFSLELLKTLPRDKPENVVFSPLSIYSLLAVLQQGANGTAGEELNKVLHATPKVTREALNNITADIEQSDSVSSLRFMWKSRIKGNHNFNPDFHQVLKKGMKPRFKSGANKPTNPPLKGMLSKIVVPSKAATRTFAALANLLYFNSHWAHEEISEGSVKFSPTLGEEFEAPALLMKKTCFSGVSPEIGAKWIHIPIAVQKKTKNTGIMPRGPYWSRRSISLMIVLPVEKYGLDKLTKNLMPQHLERFLNYSVNEDRKDVELVIPTFHVNTSTSYRPLLKKMGLRSVFESGSGLTVSTDQHLYVSKITQKGQFIVDQFGARTEEETNINFPYHFHQPWKDVDPFTIDQPFLFFVVDRTYSLPLFAGRITRPQPTAWNPYNDDDDALQFPQY